MTDKLWRKGWLYFPKEAFVKKRISSWIYLSLLELGKNTIGVGKSISLAGLGVKKRALFVPTITWIFGSRTAKNVSQVLDYKKSSMYSTQQWFGKPKKLIWLTNFFVKRKVLGGSYYWFCDPLGLKECSNKGKGTASFKITFLHCTCWSGKLFITLQSQCVVVALLQVLTQLKSIKRCSA